MKAYRKVEVYLLALTVVSFVSLGSLDTLEKRRISAIHDQT
jgi:hypothetical protein